MAADCAFADGPGGCRLRQHGQADHLEPALSRTFSTCRNQVGQVGFPLQDIVEILTERGDVAPEDRDAVIEQFKTLDTPFTLVLRRAVS